MLTPDADGRALSARGPAIRAVQGALQVDGTPPHGLSAPGRAVRPCAMLRTARLAGAALAAAALLPAAPALGAVHTVSPGETLWGIAQSSGVSASAVAAANGLSSEAHVIAGTTLTIPAAGVAGATTSAAPIATSSAAAPAAAGGGLRVRWGDTLSAIAVRNGVSLARLAAVNGLDPARPLLAGTTLHLPTAGGAGASAAPAATTSAAPAPMGAYEVRPGDTLSELAARSRVPLAQMAFMNGLDPDKPLLAGTVIKLPTGSPVTSSAPAPQRTIVPAAPPAATPGRLTSGQIGSIAAQQGAPGSLAAAIAWQESGNNNAMLSGANARGVMQILPGTWEWVQANLARTRPDPSSPEDNVRAGSLYLADLLRQTNGDPAMAAAAYYQGLSSVRRIGMLPETRRYVANVMALRSRFGG
jgi:LysM repeat protein